MVDFTLSRKKTATRQLGGVIFAQTVPDAARAEYKRGVNSLKGNKPEEAIVSLKKAIEIFPDYYLALELLGTEYVKRGGLDEAVPILTQAVKINRAAPKSLYALGVALMKLNRLVEAIEWLQKASDQDSGNVNVHMMLGIAYGNKGALAEAEASLKKASQLGGDRIPDLHLYLAGIYNKQEKYSAAVRELELYLKEEKELKDPTRVKEMIDKLKAKEKAKK